MFSLTKSWAAILTGTIFLSGLGLGAWAMYSWYVSELREAMARTQERLSSTEQLLYMEKQKPPVVKTETKTITELAYIPKETIIYKDAVSGTEVVVQEKTDVDMNARNPWGDQ